MVSTLLPYCDAMFIDNRCRRLLAAASDGAGLDYATEVFSMASQNELLEWLADVESAAGAEHVALVKQIYGDGWLEPYTSLFEELP